MDRQYFTRRSPGVVPICNLPRVFANVTSVLLIAVPHPIYLRLTQAGLMHSPFRVISEALETYIQSGMPEVAPCPKSAKTMNVEYKIPHALSPIVDALAHAGGVGREEIVLRALIYQSAKDEMN